MTETTEGEAQAPQDATAETAPTEQAPQTEAAPEAPEAPPEAPPAPPAPPEAPKEPDVVTDPGPDAADEFEVLPEGTYDGEEADPASRPHKLHGVQSFPASHPRTVHRDDHA